MKDGEMTASEAAKRLGIGMHHVYTLIWEGKIEATKDENWRWVVSSASVEERRKALEKK